MKYSFFSLKNNTVKERIINVLVCLIVIVLLIIILEFFEHNYNFEIPCVFYKLTGLYCPGCGITRGIESLARLDLYQAFRYNVLLMSSLPFIGLCVIDKVVSYIRNKNTWFYDKIPNYIWITFLIIAIIFAILRNIPPFDFLAPTKI